MFEEMIRVTADKVRLAGWTELTYPLFRCDNHVVSDMQPEQVSLNVQWAMNPSSIPVPANNLLVVEGVGIGASTAGTFELHLGHVSPPPLMAETPEQMAALVRDATVYVNPVSHVVVTVDVLRQYYETIGQALGKYDAARG